MQVALTFRSSFPNIYPAIFLVDLSILVYVMPYFPKSALNCYYHVSQCFRFTQTLLCQVLDNLKSCGLLLSVRKSFLWIGWIVQNQHFGFSYMIQKTCRNPAYSHLSSGSMISHLSTGFSFGIRILRVMRFFGVNFGGVLTQKMNSVFFSSYYRLIWFYIWLFGLNP